MRHHVIHSLVLMTVIILVLGACAADPTATPVPAPIEAPAQPQTQPTDPPLTPAQATAAAQPAAPKAAPPASGDAGAWQADGTIAAGEYDHQDTFGQVTLSWRNDADYLYLAMSGKTEGWVAVGLDPENRMQGANFILGFVQAGELSIFDAYGQGPVGPTHPPDVEVGGSDDIVAAGGVEIDGMTTIEFQIPLDSGDTFDKALTPGQTVKVLVALGRADEFNGIHAFRGGGELALDGVEARAPAPTSPPPTEAPVSTEPPAAPTEVPSVELSWTADGVLSEGEYTGVVQVGQAFLHWRHDGEYLYAALQAPVAGWVSVGFDPENRMQGANFVLGYVENGEAMIFDAYGQGPVGATHPPDTDIGGSDDIVAFGGSETGGATTLEFQIPLDSGDAFDKPLVPGQSYTVLLAYADQDGFAPRHSFRGAGTMALQ